MSNNRLFSLEDTFILKGAAIFLIFCQHIGQAYNISILNPLGPVGVCLFLFLSAYGLSYSYDHKGSQYYFLNKIVKVYIPYILIVCIYVIWNFFLDKMTDMETFLNYLMLIQLPQASYWYLILMFWWYLVFYFYICILEKTKDKYYIPKYIDYLICIVLSLVISFLMNMDRLFIWQIFSFPLGIVAYNFEKQGKVTLIVDRIRKKSLSVLLVSVSICLIILKRTSYIQRHELGFADTIIQIILTLVLSSLVIVFEKNLKGFQVLSKLKIIFFRIGIISYEIYLSHALLLDSLKKHRINFLQYIFAVLVVIFLLNKVTDFLKQKLYAPYKI
ncbi:acyltransferase family protein [Streptococcus pneumoniae]